jgi:hypothetical protein
MGAALEKLAVGVQDTARMQEQGPARPHIPPEADSTVAEIREAAR